MIITGISDIHGSIDSLEKVSVWLSEADIVLVSGDVTHFGREHEAKKVVETLKKFCKKLYLVPGNCDHPDVGEFLSREGINLHRTVLREDDLIITGVGGSLHAPGRTPNEYTEEDFNIFLNEFNKYRFPQNKLLILVSHQPPYGTRCDVTFNGLHVGSIAIRNFIEEVQPFICLTGHIHESRGIDRIGKTIVINPGPVREGIYVQVELKGKEKNVRLRKGGKVLNYQL